MESIKESVPVSPSFSPEQMWQLGIHCLVHTWGITAVALNNHCGGHDTLSKVFYLQDELILMFPPTEKDAAEVRARVPDQIEVEELLTEYLLSEMSIVVEDGSIESFAEIVCALYSECKRGKHEVFLSLRDIYRKQYSEPVRRPGMRPVPESVAEVHSDEDVAEKEKEEPGGDSSPPIVAPQGDGLAVTGKGSKETQEGQSVMSAAAAAEDFGIEAAPVLDADDTPAPADDGWAVVGKGNKGRRRRGK